MKKLSLYIFLFGFSLGFAQNELQHRAKIYYKNTEQLTQLSKHGVSISHGFHKKNYSIESDFSDSELQIAKSLGFSYDIVIQNVQQFYLDQNNPESVHYVSKTEAERQATLLCPPTDDGTISEFPTPENYNEGSMGGFFTHDEIMQELDDMYAYCQKKGINIISKRADNINPDKPNDLKTVEGRYQQWVKISDNADGIDETNEPQILYTAIHHAREAASQQQLIFFMWFLIENYETSKEVRHIVDNTELYFIPLVNPDGYVRNEKTNPNGGGNHRKNRNGSGSGNIGVDNNRNYSYITPSGKEVWNTKGTSSNKTNDTYPGTGPFSEAENRAIRYFVETHEFVIALNAHSSGELLLFPYGYDNNKPTPEHSYFKEFTNAMVSKNGYDNKISAALYPAAGDSDDFMYGMLKTANGGTRKKIYAMTPEIGRSFWPAKNKIIGICKDMAHTNIVAAKLATNYATLKDESNNNTESITFPVKFALTRYGITEPANYTVSITPVSSNIDKVGESITFNTIDLNKTKTGTITVNLNSTIKNGDAFTFKLNLDNGYYTTSQVLTKVFGNTTPIFEDDASSLEHWETDGWGVTTEDYKSTPSAITDSPNNDYPNNNTSSITLKKTINLTNKTIQDAKVSYFAKWDIENRTDYVQIEASADNGATWIPLCGNYTNTGYEKQIGAENEPVYDGKQANWVQEQISLNDFIGKTVKLRFNLVTDEAVKADGFYFDDFKITVLGNNLSTDTFDLKKYVTIYPNPVKDYLTINSALENLQYQVTNMQGQILLKSNTSKKQFKINYSKYPNGIYMLKIFANNNQKTFKIIKN